MTNEEVKLAKLRYEKLLLEKLKYEEDLKRFKALERNPLIREYFELKNILELKKGLYKEENIVRNAVYSYSFMTNSSNEILAYMGAYKKEDSLMEKPVNENDADYVAYEDLENSEIYRIEPSNKEEFEKGKNIIYPDYEDFKGYSHNLMKLKTEFYKAILDSTQEKAVQKILNKKQGR